MGGAGKMTQFLYPTSRKFPFDDACGDVVRGLEARNWDVPGITVEPLVEYRGDYDDPVYLVNRELDFDEVEPVGEKEGGD